MSSTPSRPHYNVLALLTAICIALILATRDCPQEQPRDEQAAQPQVSQPKTEQANQNKAVAASVNENKNKQKVRRVKAKRQKPRAQIFDASGGVIQ